MNTSNILVIEDDPIVGRTISRTLQSKEFKVTLANSGVEGLKTARRYPPDLIVLDVIMPGMDGYTVCKEIRADPVLKDTPILFLTAKIKEEDRIEGLRAGADDYLSKPFNIDELILRVRAILRRTKQRNNSAVLAGSSEVLMDEDVVSSTVNLEPSDGEHAQNSHYLNVGDFTLNTRTFKLQTPHAGKILLTPVQYDLLYHLMCHPGQVFSPDRLLEEVWDYPTDSGSPDLVRVHIKNLRQRIEKNPRSPKFIRTVPGYGYTIGEESE